MSIIHGSTTLITGGAGGAKFAEGLNCLIAHEKLNIIPNIGDDDLFHGLWVSPDVDTLLYTLANDINREQGWGLKDDTYTVLNRLAQLGQADWMKLGDKDFATHIVRTMMLAQGHDLQQVATYLADKLNVRANIILPSRQTVQTRLHTAQGTLSMESYFVEHGTKPQVEHVESIGDGLSQANPECIEALESVETVLISPSNPILSIAPTLNVQGVQHALKNTAAHRIAISPIIAGQSVKGPACEVMSACGYSPTVTGVAEFYRGLIDALVIDHADEKHATDIRRMGIDVLVTDTLMPTITSRIQLAKEVLSYAETARLARKQKGAA